MKKHLRKKILYKIIKPIVNTEGKLEDKVDYIFGCLIKRGIVTDEDKTCFLTEVFKHISQISDDMSTVFDKAVMKALKKLNISIEEEDEEVSLTKEGMRSPSTTSTSATTGTPAKAAKSSTEPPSASSPGESKE